MFLRPQLIRGGGQGLGLLPLLLFLPEACPEHQLCPSIIAGPPPHTQETQRLWGLLALVSDSGSCFHADRTVRPGLESSGLCLPPWKRWKVYQSGFLGACVKQTALRNIVC